MVAMFVCMYVQMQTQLVKVAGKFDCLSTCGTNTIN